MVFDPTGKDHLIMTDASIIYRFLHAGKGEVTLVAPTLKAHSYKFLSPTNPADFDPDTIFVYVLHDGHKMYVGKLTDQGLVMTRGSRFHPDTEAFKGARFITQMATSQDLVDSTPMKLYQSGKCCMCGREIIAEKTVKEGIGRKCAARYAEWIAKGPWDGND